MPSERARVAIACSRLSLGSSWDEREKKNCPSFSLVANYREAGSEQASVARYKAWKGSKGCKGRKGEQD